ncbi:MAG: restriction endonuclease subunit S [Nanoarchaeota archaeon]|nr:restriction endonuclease subunit S [Nanoarchaeota archaeon]MCG2719230.1 restriction endonuclease subunit S [Nanoarchaeota archaeon]
MKLPNGWKKVKFGDVVKKINDKVSNREEWTFDRYIGGEHFDEGEIRVTKSNPIKENEEVIGSAFHMRFKPGQVLYVTRNPRLRKGGMVDFEGVCSNVSFVMEADEKELLQSLLPFIIQTEDFVRHTCNNAHGSTNPFLNWKDIAKYEFLLPSLEEQKKISEVLWSVEENLKKILILLNKVSLFKRNSFIFNYFGIKNYFTYNKIIQVEKGWEVLPLKKLIKYRKEKATPPYNSKKYVSLEHIESGNRNLLKYSDSKSVRSVTNKFYKGDILYGKLRPNLDKVAVAQFDGICTTEILVLNPQKNEDFSFVFEHITSQRFKDYNVQMSYGTKMPRTSDKIINKYLVPYPPPDVRSNIGKSNDKIHNFELSLRKEFRHLKSLRNKISNELLSGKLRLP